MAKNIGPEVSQKTRAVQERTDLDTICIIDAFAESIFMRATSSHGNGLIAMFGNGLTEEVGITELASKVGEDILTALSDLLGGKKIVNIVDWWGL